MSWKFKSIKLKFEPRDLWIGLYWCTSFRILDMTNILQVYLIAIPTIVLLIELEKDILEDA